MINFLLSWKENFIGEKNSDSLAVLENRRIS